MKIKIIGLLVCTLLIAYVTPVASFPLYINETSSSNQILINQPVFDEILPIPGEMSNLDIDLTIPDNIQKISTTPQKINLKGTDPTIINMIQQVDDSLILGYLQDLVSFGPRVTESTACYQAADYIYNEFDDMGLDVRFHDWSYSGYSDRNVEATLYGINESSDEIYIICGHYDSVSGSPGADDDASGVANVMAAAYIMSQYSFDHNIRFVAFSGEEQGLLGSHEYAEESYNNGDNIVGVLNVDMIGYTETIYDGNNMKIYENDASEWLTDFIDTVSQEYHDYIYLDIIPSGYTWGSDHYSFWQFGYDAIFGHEYKFSPYWHTPQDTIANMNVTYNAKCSKLTLASLAELSQTCITSEPPLAPTITGPNSGTIGEEIEFTLVTTDPENDDVYYFVDWGDGTNSGWVGPYASGEEALISNTWESTGEYDIQAKAQDTNNANSNWSDPLHITIIENDPPSIPTINGKTVGLAGVEYEFSFVANDPEADDVYYYVDWGDDTNSDWVGPYSSGSTAVISHSWEEKGTYTIQARAKDTHEAKSDWASQKIYLLFKNQQSAQNTNLHLSVYQIISNIINLE